MSKRVKLEEIYEIIKDCLSDEIFNVLGIDLSEEEADILTHNLIIDIEDNID